MGLVLASRSPRRATLLRFLTDDFTVRAADVQEVAPRSLNIGDAVQVIARKKALAVSALQPDAHVLAADTVVALGDWLLDKAATPEEERERLAALSGSTHQVWTGLALAWNGAAVDAAHAVTAVHVDRLPAEAVDRYVASRQWEGKAGGYGIQDALLAPWIRIQAGPWSNVVGLPLALTRDLLRRNRIACRDPPAEGSLRDHNPFDAAPPSPGVA